MSFAVIFRRMLAESSNVVVKIPQINYEKPETELVILEYSKIPIVIETPKGSYRSGKNPDGSEWKFKMNCHYGYIKNTDGADGDGVDVFVNEQNSSNLVYIIDQINPESEEFDEHKIMIGFNTEKEAIDMYKSHYEKGWEVGPVTLLSIEEFKEWLSRPKNLKKPYKEASSNEALRHFQKVDPEMYSLDSLLGELELITVSIKNSSIEEPKAFCGKGKTNISYGTIYKQILKDVYNNDTDAFASETESGSSLDPESSELFVEFLDKCELDVSDADLFNKTFDRFIDYIQARLKKTKTRAKAKK